MADDTTVFLSDVQSLKKTFSVLYLFGQASGLKLNKSKTEAMWLGIAANDTLQPCGIKWVTEVFSLGIWFCTDERNSISRNYSEK